ncbi:phosphoribosylformylglycinamidine synthase-associated small membrane protein [Pleomorphomonas sp. NRK KF1]|nr:phosphoribosylformylglycinamidine synthase-associated small membrane protein [Pleomorphomonas sp. NRK KF1]MCM5555689.1 phosphoribosylformylglycinamidine synthase [Pleomorphomonas sp. NRK KF1]
MADGPDDTRRIIRFMLVKAAIFVGIPVVAATLAVLFLMP